MRVRCIIPPFLMLHRAGGTGKRGDVGGVVALTSLHLQAEALTFGVVVAAPWKVECRASGTTSPATAELGASVEEPLATVVSSSRAWIRY